MFPEEGQTRYHLPPRTREDGVQLMSGLVPEEIRDCCRRMVEWSLKTPHGVSYEALNASYQQQQHDKAPSRGTPRRGVRPRGTNGTSSKKRSRSPGTSNG
jgi:hypothetical protein